MRLLSALLTRVPSKTHQAYRKGKNRENSSSAESKAGETTKWPHRTRQRKPTLQPSQSAPSMRRLALGTGQQQLLRPPHSETTAAQAIPDPLKTAHRMRGMQHLVPTTHHTRDTHRSVRESSTHLLRRGTTRIQQPRDTLSTTRQKVRASNTTERCHAPTYPFIWHYVCRPSSDQKGTSNVVPTFDFKSGPIASVLEVQRYSGRNGSRQIRL